MKNTDAMQVFAGIAIVLILGLSVATYFSYKDYNKTVAATAEAEKKAESAEKEMQDMAAKHATMVRMVSGRDGVDTDKIESDFVTDMDRYKKAIERTFRADGDRNRENRKTAMLDESFYNPALKNLAEVLKSKNDELKTLEDKNKILQADFVNYPRLYNTIDETFNREKNAAVKNLADEQKKFQRDLDSTISEMEKIQNDKITEVNRLVEEKDDLSTKKEEVEKELAVVTTELPKATQELEDLLRPNVDHFIGNVVSVDLKQSEVTINLGSADGLSARMTFSVYDPSVTSISFTTDTNEKMEICEICKRDRSLRGTKGTIEVLHIIGPHQAVARILDDVILSPIVPGDGIYTPLWKPGQRLHFALGAGMHVIGLSQHDESSQCVDLETVRHIISMEGGVVDCYIDSDGKNDDSTDRKIIGEISYQTNYFVTDYKATENDQEQAPMLKANNQLWKNSQYRAIPISYKDLLRILHRSGWPNVADGSNGQKSHSDVNDATSESFRPRSAGNPSLHRHP